MADEGSAGDTPTQEPGGRESMDFEARDRVQEITTMRGPALIDKVQRIQRELGLRGLTTPAHILNEAAEQLNLEKRGSMHERADACLACLGISFPFGTPAAGHQVAGAPEEPPHRAGHTTSQGSAASSASPLATELEGGGGVQQTEAPLGSLEPLSAPHRPSSLASATQIQRPTSLNESLASMGNFTWYQPSAAAVVEEGFSLQRLAELLDSAAQALSSIEGRDVVLVMGKTGVGKSTLMQFLAGKRLRKHGEGYEALDALANFEIGHSMRSETLVIRHLLLSRGAEREVVYLDSAGYGDSRGEVVDVATSACLRQVADRCRRLRFVVLLDARTLNAHRGEAVREVLSLVSSFVEDFTTFHQCFTFLFTHTEQVLPMRAKSLDEKAGFLVNLLAEIESGTEGRQHQLKNMLHWMVACLEQRLPFVGFFHPELTDSQELARRCELFQARPSEEPLTALGLDGEPAGRFVRYGLTHSMMRRISSQLDMATEELGGALQARQPEIVLRVHRTFLFLKDNLLLDIVKGKAREALQRLHDACVVISSETWSGVEQGTSDLDGWNRLKALVVLQNIAFLQNLAPLLPDDAVHSLVNALQQRLDALTANVVASLPSRGGGAAALPSHGGAVSPSNGGPALSADVRATAPTLLSSSVLASVPGVLALLQAWAQAEQEMGQPGGQLAARAQRFSRQVEGLASCFLGKVSAIHGEDVDDVVLLVDALACLEELQSALPRWRALGVQVHRLEERRRTAMEKVRTFLHCQVDNAIRSLDFHRDADQLSLITNIVSYRENVQAAIAVIAQISKHENLRRCSSALVEDVRQVEQVLYGRLMDVWEHCSSQVAEALAKADRSVLAEDAVTCSKTSGDALRDSMWVLWQVVEAAPEALQREMSVQHLRVCENIFGVLERHIKQAWSGLDRLYHREHLVVVIELLPRFVLLQACSWLDEHQMAASQPATVVHLVSHLRAAYRQHFQHILQVVESGLRGLCQPAAGIRQQGPLLADLAAAANLADLGNVFDEFNEDIRWLKDVTAGLCSNLLAQFQIAVMCWVPRQLLCLNEFPADLLDHVLQVAASLTVVGRGALRFLADQADPLQAQVMTFLQNLSQTIQGRLSAELQQDSEGRQAPRGTACSLACGLLGALRRWEEQRLVLLLAALPKLEDLTRHVLQHVHNEAELLRSKVAASTTPSDLDGVASDVERFEVWCQLDNFTQGRPSLELKGLQDFLQLRRLNVDLSICEKIARFDLQNVALELERLRGGTAAPANGDRLTALLDCLSSAVMTKVERAAQLLHSGSDVGAIVTELRHAQREVGRALLDGKGLDLSNMLSDLVIRAEEHFGSLLSELHTATALQDFCRMAESEQSALAYADGAACILGRTAQDRFHQLQEQAATVLDKVDGLVKAFIDRDAGAEPDSADLLKLLGVLKDGACRQPPLPRLAAKYEGVQLQLRDQLQCWHLDTQRRVNESGLYVPALEGYQWLQQAMDAGLSEHVSGLCFRPADELRRLREMEEGRMSDFEQLLRHKGYVVNECLASLDRWKRLGWPQSSVAGIVQRVLGYSREQQDNQTQYNKYKEGLVAALQRMHHTAMGSLDRSAYDLAAANLVAVEHAAEQLKQHLDESMLAEWRAAWKDKMSTCFGALVSEISGSLKSRHIDSFCQWFWQYHDWLRHLKHCCPLRLDCADLQQEIRGLLAALNVSFQEKNAKEIRNNLEYLRQVAWALNTVGALCLDEQPMPELEALRDEINGRRPQLPKVGKAYAVLKLQLNASHRDIHSSYRRMSIRCHPDKVPDCPSKTAEFLQLQSARDALVGLRERWFKEQLDNLFSDRIRCLPQELRDQAASFLHERGYRQVKKALTSAEDLEDLVNLTNPPLNLGTLCSDIRASVKAHASELEARAATCWQHKLGDAAALQEFGQCLASLEAVNSLFSAYPDIYSVQGLCGLDRLVEEEVERWALAANGFLKNLDEEAWKALLDFGTQLVLIGRVFKELPRHKDLAKLKLNMLLTKCLEQPWGANYLFKLGMDLEAGKIGRPKPVSEGSGILVEDEMIGKVIVSEFSHFTDVRTVIWNQQTGATQRDITSTLDGIRGSRVEGSGECIAHIPDTINLDVLRDGFVMYTKEFDKHFDNWQCGELRLPDLVCMVKQQVAAIGPCTVSNWTDAVRTELPSLLARILVYYTISKSGESFRRLALASDQGQGERVGVPSNLQNVLMKAHVVQVLSALRLLGYDGRGQGRLVSHLFQIGTGEGKSMILGVSSLVLALFGFNVYCICYSEYLSHRDFSHFETLFRDFGVINNIKYSTIGSYVDHSLSELYDTRQPTKELITGTLEPSNSLEALQRTRKDEILLMDEVDVFFSPNFYGETHNYSAWFSSEEVRQLILAIWEQRLKAGWAAVLYNNVQLWPQCQRLLDKYPGWHDVVLKEVEIMCRDCDHWEHPTPYYDAINDSIAYRFMDGMGTWTYGYRTAFAYLKLSRDTARRNLGKFLQLKVSCGRFSYAKIRADCILGVSGTLDTLGDYAWQVMRSHGIEGYTVLPSVYGPSHFSFLQQVGGKPVIVSTSLDEMHLTITNEVRNKTQQGRAAIVFFKDHTALEAYAATHYAGTLQNKGLLLETHTDSEKEFAIKRAASPAQVTLTTRVFGRGTDFVCIDKRLKQAGGVHVIQTFLSADLSEERQIQGRTARQGDNGSYGLVLLREDLETLGLDATLASSMSFDELYRSITEKIKEKCVQASSDRKRKLAEADQQDQWSREYAEALRSGDAVLAGKRLRRLCLDS